MEFHNMKLSNGYKNKKYNEITKSNYQQNIIIEEWMTRHLILRLCNNTARPATK